jgi:hypothetical protein
MFSFFRKKKKDQRQPLPQPAVPGKDKSIPDKPESFGPRCMWFAIRTEDTQRVIEVMALKHSEPCNWAVGIEKAYEDDIFITPPIDGWTMVVGWGLPSADTPEGIREVKESLLLLSKEFGEAQYFITHRTVDYHLWMKAVNGSGIRAFGFGEGENVIIEGDPADFAARLDNAEEVSQKKFTIVQNFTNPGEQTVMDIAGKWSVDPSMLSDRNDLEPGLGILAKSDFLLK